MSFAGDTFKAIYLKGKFKYFPLNNKNNEIIETLDGSKNNLRV